MVIQPQCPSEVVQVSVGAFTLQTTSQRHQIIQCLKTSRERETLEEIQPSQVKKSLFRTFFSQTHDQVLCDTHMDASVRIVRK